MQEVQSYAGSLEAAAAGGWWRHLDGDTSNPGGPRDTCGMHHRHRGAARLTACPLRPSSLAAGIRRTDSPATPMSEVYSGLPSPGAPTGARTQPLSIPGGGGGRSGGAPVGTVPISSSMPIPIAGKRSLPGELLTALRPVRDCALHCALDCAEPQAAAACEEPHCLLPAFVPLLSPAVHASRPSPRYHPHPPPLPLPRPPMPAEGATGFPFGSLKRSHSATSHSLCSSSSRLDWQGLASEFFPDGAGARRLPWQLAGSCGGWQRMLPGCCIGWLARVRSPTRACTWHACSTWATFWPLEALSLPRPRPPPADRPDANALPSCQTGPTPLHSCPPSLQMGRRATVSRTRCCWPARGCRAPTRWQTTRRQLPCSCPSAPAAPRWDTACRARTAPACWRTAFPAAACQWRCWAALRGPPWATAATGWARWPSRWMPGTLGPSSWTRPCRRRGARSRPAWRSLSWRRQGWGWAAAGCWGRRRRWRWRAAAAAAACRESCPCQRPCTASRSRGRMAAAGGWVGSFVWGGGGAGGGESWTCWPGEWIACAGSALRTPCTP